MTAAVAVWCRVCEDWTVPFDGGGCPWCDHHPATGILDVTLASQTRREQRREARAAAARRYRRRAAA